jgi:LAO/AO transport system kinase
MVAEIVDMFVLLVPPAGGDELQGLKKGIVEHSDLVIVNKADGVLASAARVAAMEYTSALKFVQANSSVWNPEVIQLSSVEQKGIDKAWETMQRFYTAMKNSGELDKKRGEQRKLWMWRQITSELIDRLNADVEVKQLVQMLESRVFDGEMTSGMAAEEVVDRFLDRARRDRL